MYSKVAAVFIKVYDATVGEFAETDLFKSASSNNEEEITNVIEDRTPTLFEEHGKLINWIYGIYKWDGINKLNEEDLFAPNDDEQNALKTPEKCVSALKGRTGKLAISLAGIFNNNEIPEVLELLNKPLTVRELYLHVRHTSGNSLIEAIKAQNELNDRKTQMEVEKNKAIEEATNEANRKANEEIAKIQANADAEIAKTKAEAAEIERKSQEGLNQAAKFEALKAEYDECVKRIHETEKIIADFKMLMSYLGDKSSTEIAELRKLSHMNETALKSELEKLI